ncbi:MAG TPA: thiamine diphosphokinase [Bacteroidota bacterium]
MKRSKRKKALVICDGELPSRVALRKLAEGVDSIACADGGANQARRYRITPDIIVGDLDSITDATRRFYRTVPLIQNSSEEQTDLEKVLDVLLARGTKDVVVVGATGRRTDHTVTNFSILKKYHRKCNLRFVDRHCEIFVVDRKVKLSGKRGELISILPLGVGRGITTKGLKYSLRNETLELGVREGQSNVIVSNPVEVSLKRGVLLLFRMHGPSRHSSREARKRSSRR